MARRSKPDLLTIRVSFEVTRISRECLADAYDRLVPIKRRHLKPASKPERSKDVAPTRREGDHG
jgi:hypothetical protein